MTDLLLTKAERNAVWDNTVGTDQADAVSQSAYEIALLTAQLEKLVPWLEAHATWPGVRLARELQAEIEIED